MSYMDKEIINDFKKNSANLIILSDTEHDLIVNTINETLPFSGSQIAWTSLAGSTYFGLTESRGTLESLSKKIQLICEDYIFVVGDSTDNGYSINTSDLFLALQIFSQIPQHTYIVPRAINWIACMSFEGHIDFAILSKELKQPRNSKKGR